MLMIVLVTLISIAALLQPAVAAPPPPSQGMPGCNTTCGNVTVPYPFGMGPPRCYLPGFNLTCDDSLNLLTGRHDRGGRMLVVGIFLENSTVRVMRKSQGTVNLTSSGRRFRWRLMEGGPYSLAAANEFIVTGCNVDATLVDSRSGGNASSCASFCMGDNPWRENMTRCSLGTCSATIASTGHTSYDVRLRPVVDEDAGVQGVLNRLPMHALIAEKGWLGVNNAFNLLLGLDQLFPTVLDWACAADDVCKSAHSVRNSSGRGYTCQCQPGYEGNPYLTGGCQGN
jgi:hypothetical protein